MSEQDLTSIEILEAERFQRDGKLPQAETIYRRVLKDNPGHSEALRLLGLLAHQTGNHKQGINLIKQAIAAQPENVEAHFNLGIINLDQNLPEDAIMCFRLALEISPKNYSCLINLGNALLIAGHYDEAIKLSNRAIETDPNNVEALSNLGNALLKSNKLIEAMSVLRRTVLLRPNDGRLINNLGMVEQTIGLIEIASQTYAEALKVDPQCKKAEHNLLINLLNLPNQTPERLFEVRRNYGNKYNRNESYTKKFASRNADIKRKLRIGYLSSDFCAHPVGFNLLPLISNHDKEKMEIYIYHLDNKFDAISKIFKSRTDNWCTVIDQTDGEIAKQIENDEVDILVSLGGRFNLNRPTVTAFRAAPIQVSFHDCCTSGLSEVDFWLTDNFLHPEDTGELFTEKLHRIPVFYQYNPPEEFPKIKNLPAKENGFITFGCFNKPEKINDNVIALWSDILVSIPHSKLFLKYGGYFNDQGLVKYWQNKFSHFGIAKNRLIFSGISENREKHLAQYQNIDIALDPFPFNGATTTFEALAMGIPVITLKGKYFVDRTAAAILNAARLNNFIAHTDKEYIELARNLSTDIDILEGIRYGLREKLITSPLCQGKPYAQFIESAYQTMWRNWCSEYA